MENKKRLIDANELLSNGFIFDNVRFKRRRFCIPWGDIKRSVKNAPTVDAVEVVHGCWHIDDYDSGEPYGYAAFIEVHCSKCGYELGAESGQYGWDYGDPFPLKYCPNCGARMDGDENA